jgi:hypothetical protein
MSDYFIKEVKSKAALLYVVAGIPGIDEHKLYQILYLAEKEHLVKYGRQIMGEIYEKHPLGMVPILFCKSIIDKGGALQRNGDLIKANEQPNLEELSVSDLECLNWSIEQNKNKDPRQLFADSCKEAYHNKTETGLIETLDIAMEGKAEKGMTEYIKNYIENSSGMQ